jgi:hypothetical protein
MGIWHSTLCMCVNARMTWEVVEAAFSDNHLCMDLKAALADRYEVLLGQLRNASDPRSLDEKAMHIKEQIALL